MKPHISDLGAVMSFFDEIRICDSKMGIFRTGPNLAIWSQSGPMVQWIGLRENLQETIDFPIKYGAFL